MAKLELHASDGAVLICGWLAVTAVAVGFTTCIAVTGVADRDVQRACVHKTGNMYCEQETSKR